MHNYLLAYHGGVEPANEDEQTEQMAAWGEWMGAHAAAFVDNGNPFGISRTVGPEADADGGGANPLVGYGIIRAIDLAAACNVARGCPIVTRSGGTVEVCEIFELELP